MKKLIMLLALALPLALWACNGPDGGEEDADAAGDPDVIPETGPDPTGDDGQPLDPAGDEGAAETPGDLAADETPADIPAEELPPGEDMGRDVNIIFLHHSTGGVIWGGGVPDWISSYNGSNDKNYQITEVAYPSELGYGWANYPYDYWNIWVNHAGPDPYLDQATLEMLTPEYDVIIFKHCFPVSGIGPDTGSPDITSDVKTIENYRLQYNALKEKLHQFPANRFIVWTGAALTANSTDPESAQRSRDFFTWVKEEWDEPGDNIFVWDFFELETEGGNVLLDGYAASPDDSHPGDSFAATVAPYFGQRIANVIQGLGDTTSLTGQ